MRPIALADIARMSRSQETQADHRSSDTPVRTVTSEDWSIEPLLKIDQVAQILNVSVKRLYTYSSEGRGPAVTKIEGQIRYRRRDVEAYIDACARQSTKQP